MRPVAIIYNPGAGQRRDRRVSVDRMALALARRGLTATIHRTEAPGDASRLCREALDSGARSIVVHGGDGTVNEAVQPMVGGSVPLVVWPGGTANVLARELRLPRNPEGVADMIVGERSRRVCVGRAGTRYFLLMAGVGLDAAVVRTVNLRLKRFTGQGAYWVAGLRKLVEWRPRRFVVSVDGVDHAATLAIIANAPSYGGGLRLAPEASMDSEHLDLCLFDWDDRSRFLRHLTAGLAGKHLGLPGVTYVRAHRATVQGDAQTWVQIDGELLSPLPMTFESVPAALSVAVPA